MKILITGGTGSLGVALLEHFDACGDEVTIFSRDEVKQGDLRRRFPGHRYVLGDVRDESWLEICMRGQQVVIHAAAYKQVPAAEVNSGEAIETNVIGSRNVARAAVRAGVGRVVGISTDKACAPINCYGETKALMEKLFQQANMWGDTIFTLVRYGNVLGSRGSVVPHFISQINAGKNITITDPNMTRFWLTLKDAVDLVCRAMACSPGVILVPRAPASTMEILAQAVLVKHTGQSLYDIDPRHVIYDTIGIRPGEKLHECMVHRSEAMHTVLYQNSFYIAPAYEIGSKAFNLEPGYEYTSDKARQLSVSDLIELV